MEGQGPALRTLVLGGKRALRLETSISQIWKGRLWPGVGECPREVLLVAGGWGLLGMIEEGHGMGGREPAVWMEARLEARDLGSCPGSALTLLCIILYPSRGLFPHL